jgi:hypothetical protein
LAEAAEPGGVAAISTKAMLPTNGVRGTSARVKGPTHGEELGGKGAPEADVDTAAGDRRGRAKRKFGALLPAEA